MPNLQEALEQAVAVAKAPGAVALVGRGDDVLFRGAAGLRQRVPEEHPATLDTHYDLASLTKMICTMTCLMRLHGEGKLDLDHHLGDYLPLDWGDKVTFRHVITHTAGLPPLLPGMRDIVHSLPEAVVQIAKVELKSVPGTRRVYSDLGFICLAQIVQLLERDTFEEVCEKKIFKPLGMKQTGFRPPDKWKKNCAATEDCPWRKRVLVGEVHDENAFAVGGVSGHAGLFSTVDDLGIFCAALLKGKVLPNDVLDEMATLYHVPFYPWQGLGWKVDPWASGAEGHLASRRAIGHTGWTGTSIWIDRDSGLYAVLLSNTCHPSRDHRDNPTLRKVFHAAVNAEYLPRRANIHVGLDRVIWDNYDAVAGKRIALLTHLAAVDELGRDPIGVLSLRPECAPRRVFTPEHGLSGSAEAGALVKGERAAVEVVSLYGEQKAPTKAQLADVDVFVVNLQDVGSRYYTYLATMKACLEACAAAGTPVLVLDRPNPLGGIDIEGPIAEQTDSLVCAAKIPVRHGMTLAEMAQFLQQTEPALKNLKLSAQLVDGWQRGLYWEALMFPWTAPSPNMPDAETALLYVGTCLFEGVNLNEGRGTDTPFQIFGAPWLDAEKVLARVPEALRTGATLTPVEYTPRSIPGKAASPVYMEQLCRGARIAITDRDAFRPFALTCAIVRAIREVHGEQLTFNKHFDKLAGGPALAKVLRSDASLADWLSGLQAELGAYDVARPRLYE